ncbi:HEAT repeat domain-containing protein [bacterium]|nr:HEAT repeat domain-containing protein [bacterium]
MIKKIVIFVVASFAILGSKSPKVISPQESKADEIVQQLRDIPTPLPAAVRSDGTIAPIEARRKVLYEDLRKLGPKAMSSLSKGLSDNDVRIRKNVALVLFALGGRWYDRSKQTLDISPCLPALIRALKDNDPSVRAWCAQSIGQIGPNAAEAVPHLTMLLSDSAEGSRNSACIALGNIGPSANQALPELEKVLSDSNERVRFFAQQAIRKIKTNE